MSTIAKLGVRVRSAADALPLDTVTVAVERLRVASELLLAARQHAERPEAVPGVARALEHAEQAGHALRVARERLAAYLTAIGLGSSASPPTEPQPADRAPRVTPSEPPRPRSAAPTEEPDWWTARIAVLTDGPAPRRRADATGDTERLLRQVVAAVRGGDRDELRAALTGAPTPIGLRLTAVTREPLRRLAAEWLGHPPTAADLPRLARATENRVRALRPGLPRPVLDTLLAWTCHVASEARPAHQPAHPADTPVAGAVLTGVLLRLLGRDPDALAEFMAPSSSSAGGDDTSSSVGKDASSSGGNASSSAGEEPASASAGGEHA